MLMRNGENDNVIRLYGIDQLIGKLVKQDTTNPRTLYCSRLREAADQGCSTPNVVLESGTDPVRLQIKICRCVLDLALGKVGKQHLHLRRVNTWSIGTAPRRPSS